MKLKLDENLGYRWARQLRSGGHDVDTIRNEGLSGAPDDDVHAAAAADGRAPVSLDLDVANPLRFPPRRGPGIAVLRVRHRPSRDEIDRVVERLIDSLDRADLTGKLWIVESERVREYVDGGD